MPSREALANPPVSTLEMAKVHWNKSADTSMCGLNSTSMSIEFTSNGQDVSCERCKKLLPVVRRTAWDLLIDEERPVEPAKPKQVRKPKAKKVPVEPGLTEEELLPVVLSAVREGFQDVRREEAMQRGFRTSYGDGKVYGDARMFGPDRGPKTRGFGRVLLLCFVLICLGMSIWLNLK